MRYSTFYVTIFRGRVNTRPQKDRSIVVTIGPQAIDYDHDKIKNPTVLRHRLTAKGNCDEIGAIFRHLLKTFRLKLTFVQLTSR